MFKQIDGITLVHVIRSTKCSRTIQKERKNTTPSICLDSRFKCMTYPWTAYPLLPCIAREGNWEKQTCPAVLFEGQVKASWTKPTEFINCTKWKVKVRLLPPLSSNHMSGTYHCRIQKQQHPSQWQPSIPIVIRINKPNFTLPSVPSVLICFLWTRELSQYSTIEWRNYCNISDSEQSYRTLCKLMPWCMQLNRECSSVTAIHYLQKEGMLVRGIRSKNGRHQSLML